MMANRAPRITVGICIAALEFQIAALKQVLPTDKEYAENMWRIHGLEEQIEALNFRPTTEHAAGWGGNWLGRLRSWVQFNFRNGSDVTWGSHTPLVPSSAMSSFRLERLAAEIAAEAVNEHMGIVGPRGTHQG